MIRQNVVFMTGNLTRDIELRFTQDGTPVANLSIAHNKSKKVGDEWEEVVSYFDIVVWDKIAERCAEHLKKGSKVHFQGELQQRRWEKDGEKYNKIAIVAWKVQWDRPPKQPEQQPEDPYVKKDDGVPF